MRLPGSRLVVGFVLAFGLLAGVPAVVAQTVPDFEDVPQGHISESAIEWAARNGITVGVGGNRFGVGETLTRYQMVTFLCRAYDPTSCSGGIRGSDSFDDVPADHWADYSVGWAVDRGITSGVSATEFGGSDTLTREQMVTFLYRAEGSPSGGPSGIDIYDDVPDDHSEWANRPIGWAFDRGVTGGIAAGTFGFGTHLSREEMVLFLCRTVAADVCPPSQEPHPSSVVPAVGDSTSTGPDDTSQEVSEGPVLVELRPRRGEATGGSFRVEVVFSKPVTGFGAGDVRVANGQVSSLSGSGSNYELGVTSAAEGTVVVWMPADVVHDAASNPNRASERLVMNRTAGSGFDTWDREAMVRAFEVEFEREEPDRGFTGSVSGCDAGATSRAFRDSVVQRVNWYRQMAGVGPVGENAQYTAGAQHAALIMAAAGRLSHHPGRDWACYTETGAVGAARSNLGGDGGVGGIDGFMQDFGSNNERVGHRSWILHPLVREVGAGSVPGGGALWVALPLLGWPDVREPRGFVAWPPPGYVPSTKVWGRWSFQLGGADFSRATVAVTDDHGPIPTRVISRSTVGNGIVWTVFGDTDSSPLYDPHDGDYCYTVTIGDVKVGGRTQDPYEYVTCLLDLIPQTDDRSFSLIPPVWSPDGSRIAFSRGGHWTIDADGTNQRFRLLGSLAWSPDGRRIAYGSQGIWVMNADGTNQRQLTAEGVSPAWSPDGSRLAYRTSGLWVTLPDGRSMFDPTGGVSVVNADGTNQKQLTTSGHSPVWSPDGSRIAYRKGGLRVVNADGTNQMTLTRSVHSQAWSPDGSRIAYAVINSGIWVVNADGTNPQRIATSGTLPAWSPDGSRIAYADGGIRIMNSDGTNQRQLIAAGVSPAWSPDGTRIAYNTWGLQLWIVNSDGTNPRQLSK